MLITRYLFIKTNMEIREILSFYINTTNEVLEVDFRLVDDEDTDMRTAEIPLLELKDYGLKFNHEKIDIIEEMEDDFDDMLGILDDEFDEDEFSIEELVPFLNEYFTVHPEKLPSKDLF